MTSTGNTSEDILESVLDQAFIPPPSKRQSVPPIPSGEPTYVEDIATPEPFSESSISSGSIDDSWKASYESQVEAWRAQSSEARVKAEKERERWEAFRVTEKEKDERRKTPIIAYESKPEPLEHEHETGWENVIKHSNQSAGAQSQTSVQYSASLPVDLSQSTAPTAPSEVSRPQSQADTGEGSQKWEDIHSPLTSSYPSFEYPDRTDTPSPTHRHVAPTPVTPFSATLAIFDSTLSTRTRVKALFSSLAINLFLPFVNGVMLGFGEIFAKNVVLQWFGWKSVGPGYLAASTGINSGIKSKTLWGGRQ